MGTSRPNMQNFIFFTSYMILNKKQATPKTIGAFHKDPRNEPHSGASIMRSAHRDGKIGKSKSLLKGP